MTALRAPRATTDPVGLHIAAMATRVIEASGLLGEDFSFQTGAGGISLAVADSLRETMYRRSVQGSFAAGGITGYIVESVAPQGYGGSIRLLTAVSTDGTISRVQVLSHHETPGLGDKIERSKSGWIDSFNGQSFQGPTDTRWAVRKDGGMFDSFTGATITPRAVVKGVKNVLVLINQHQNELAQAPACQETP